MRALKLALVSRPIAKVSPFLWPCFSNAAKEQRKLLSTEKRFCPVQPCATLNDPPAWLPAPNLLMAYDVLCLLRSSDGTPV